MEILQISGVRESCQEEGLLQEVSSKVPQEKRYMEDFIPLLQSSIFKQTLFLSSFFSH